MRLSRLAPLALSASALCQQTLHPTVKPSPRPPAVPGSPSSELPITHVALYKNGVGFFEHEGRVTGDQSVTIDFTSAQLNDVLQSLTAIDLNGGRISGAGYNSTTPLEQQLKTLPLALTADPSDVDFYSAIRGARVQVTAPGVSITGRLLSIDLRNAAEKEGHPATERRFITVVSEAGAIRTLELNASTSVTLLDTALHTDVTRYLELLASTRNQGLRHLTLLDRGTGPRDLRVSYISEVPVWKSTYRILFTDAKQKSPGAPSQAASPLEVGSTATLQGWSVVDNTTGTDWINVHLDLIAGAPQSFIQPLSIPYYSRRPEIALPSEAQLAPQTHDSGEMTGYGLGQGAGMAGMVGSAARGVMAAPIAAKDKVYIDGFTGGALPMNGRNRAMASVNVDALSDDPDALNAQLQNLAGSSFGANTTTAAFDDFFKYALTDPITIRKNESALVPTLQAKLPIERVTLWSQQQPVALRALWLTNSSDLTLDRGSFSIVENGSFGGEGLLDPIHPGEKRLLSYAADQAVHVDSKQDPQKHVLRSVIIAKGLLTEHYRDVSVRDYTIRNAAPESRTVVIEHARLADHQLNADTTQKPDETLPNAYRFRVIVAAGATVHLKVAESHAYPSTTQVGSINDQEIKILVMEMGKDASLTSTLQPIIDAQARIADLNAQKRSVDDHLKNLRTEEERQRANILALKDVDKLSQKRFVDELGRIEDQILDLQKQQTTLDTQLDVARKDLADKVQQVQFNQTLEP